MKTAALPRFWRSQLSIMISILFSAVVPNALGEVVYSVTDLGTLPSFSYAAWANGINNRGQVVGYCDAGNGGAWGYNTTRAFLYDQGNLLNLGTIAGGGSYGLAINNHGEIAGALSWINPNMSSYSHSLFYSAGSMTDLQPWISGSSVAQGINLSGQIVGRHTTSSGYWHAFLYSAQHATDLGVLPGTTYSCANGINDNGQIVGVAATNAFGDDFAFFYTNGTMTSLGRLPGFTRACANAINNSSQVVGYVGTSGNLSRHAFLYDGGNMVDLGGLPNLPFTEAMGINNGGQIVGYACTNYVSSGRAFLYSGGQLVDLNTLIPSGSGWIFGSATGINDRGQIVGSGTRQGSYRAFLLTPLRLLSFNSSSTNLVMSWSTNVPTGISLFQSTGRASADWVAVTNIPTLTNQQYQVLTSPLSSGNCFYRLQSE